MEFEVERMEPLFADQADYDAFTERHAMIHVLKTADLATYERQLLSSELMQAPQQPKLLW